jgi:uncharacterized protein YndB with AHSA1/START domain
MSETTTRSAVHGSFTVERTYPADVSRVWKAFSQIESKRQWFGGADEQGHHPLEMEFRVGGGEPFEGTHEGTTHTFVSKYMDIIDGERIVTSYEMYVNGERMSVSVATYEFEAVGETTQFTWTEHGVFLDGLDYNAQREEGTNELASRIVIALQDGRL